MLLNGEFHEKGVNLSNRLVMAPMATASAKENGEVSDELLSYYAEKREVDILVW